MKIGRTDYAYVVDRQGRLIAHPDMSLVLRDTSFAQLPQVAAGLRELEAPEPEAAIPVVEPNFDGRQVLSAHAALPALGWLVFVELPMTEALQPLFASAVHTVLVMAAGLMLAALAALFVVQRMTRPIRLLEAGAARIGAGDLDAHIEVRTGDELETLANQFNSMAGQLKRSYSGLEQTVEERTRDLARSVNELQALSEVGRAVNSTLDLNTVLRTIVEHAIALAEADAGALFRFNEAEGTFEIAESSGLDSDFVAKLRSLRIASRETAMGEAALTRGPIQLADLALGPSYPLRDASLKAGFHSALVVPLIAPERALGALVLVRRAVGDFAPAVVELMTTFANQSVLAMQNAYLFEQLADKGRQLELASAHKSQFLANMSHELRTPLNAILGYTELLVDGLYGELPEKPRAVLERVQENGHNLLALINDVLDLTKIEAGQLRLTIDDYNTAELAQGVVTAMEPLARAKGLSLAAHIEGTIPPGRGDAQRLRQVLVNLVGNAIKFTDEGGVEVTISALNDRFLISVCDTGPGIAPEDQEAIFEEFHQIDNSSTRKKGGTGLGLAIVRQIVALHGGRLTLVSNPGEGATFTIDIPIRSDVAAEAVP
jgi:signal transduction histidine kinase